MDTSKITNVLIFKEGYYWLTVLSSISRLYPEAEQLYSIVKEDVFHLYGIDRNGFEFASDAYAYIASLQEKKQNHITLDMKEEIL